ncbi:hypothetical protein [Paracidovorax citrulli]|uniref:hypothetical protein n=1 Tax=Paracidovorax citrulli TaxID=80869 RepID=UPI003FA79F6F
MGILHLRCLLEVLVASPLTKRDCQVMVFHLLKHLPADSGSKESLCGLSSNPTHSVSVDLYEFAHLSREERCQQCERIFLSREVLVDAERTTVWVHSLDGTNVGRFSMLLGMDVHTTFEEQLRGGRQCLHCTHEVPSREDWFHFCALMLQHYGVTVDPELLTFGGAARKGANSTGDELAQSQS